MDVCINSMHACMCVCGFKSGIVKLTLCEMDFMRIFWITVDIFWKDIRGDEKFWRDRKVYSESLENINKIGNTIIHL